jgi:hypothetical protein
VNISLIHLQFLVLPFMKAFHFGGFGKAPNKAIISLSLLTSTTPPVLVRAAA